MIPVSRRVAAFATMLLAAVGTSSAQERPVGDTADRPGYADSPLTVGRHAVQVEGGWLLQRVHAEGAVARDVTLPQLELRAGVTSRFELAVWWDGLVRHSESGQASTGQADPRIGAKLTLLDRDRGALAVGVSASLPAGSDDVTSGTVDGLARLVWSASLTDAIDAGGSLDLGLVSHEGRRLAAPALSGTLGHALPGGASGFAGFYVEAPEGRSVLREWSLQAGVTKGIGTRAQVDVWGGRRVNGPRSWFVGAGWVQRVH